MLYVLCNKSDISDGNYWLENWFLETNSPAVFTCNYSVQEFKLLGIQVILSEKSLNHEPGLKC